MNGVFNIMSYQNTSCPSMTCIVVWYVLLTTKTVAASIPDQGSYSSKYLFCKSSVHMTFAMNCWILCNIEFACGFYLVAHLALIPYFFLFSNSLTRDP